MFLSCIKIKHRLDLWKIQNPGHSILDKELGPVPSSPHTSTKALLWVLVISYLGYPLFLHFQQRLPKSAGIWLCGFLLKDLWGLPGVLRREPRSFNRSFNALYNLTLLTCTYHLSLFLEPCDPVVTPWTWSLSKAGQFHTTLHLLMLFPLLCSPQV